MNQEIKMISIIKKFLIAFLFLFLYSVLYPQVYDGFFRIMTFNIRYDNPDDGPFVWDKRKDLVISMIRFYHPDIIGVQEALKNQLDDLNGPLEKYQWFGMGREDGNDLGEFAAIFYNKFRFKFEKGNTFWLSENPLKPGSRSWNTACTRIATWVKLWDKQTEKCLYVFNTHFDHISEWARKESARLLLKKINEIAGKHPLFVTGDFNCLPGSDPYWILTDSDNPLSLTDTRNVSFYGHHGSSYTFIGFPAKENTGRTIDYIFVKNREHIKILQHGILTDHWDGFYPSDHLPVLVEVLFTN
jgi:endonuclease/exonuclease/phosphatase family metal-dependent hydrolase